MTSATNQIQKAVIIQDLCEKHGLTLIINNDYYYFSKAGKIISSGMQSIDEGYGWIDCYNELIQD